jgi:methylthioribulose-1-phosphate dehydratase
MSQQQTPAQLIVELCRHFYDQGWVSGTGGGISIRTGGRVYIAPSGVQKERIREEDLYVMDDAGAILESPASPGLKPSACQPLFFNAFTLRNAGAVIHSHSVYALMATLLGGGSRETFECTEIEMIKGIEGHGYYDRLVVPIIENTAHEHELADSMAAAIKAHPRTQAVLVRRHGVYIWGKDWVQAKTHAECYHYLFEAAVRMQGLGFDAAASTSAGASDTRLGVVEGGKR